MRVDVYDTYATEKDGGTIHFDVLVPSGTSAETAFKYACTWLSTVRPADTVLKQSRCNFCHSESANQEVASDIEADGFRIIRMEGCSTG